MNQLKKISICTLVSFIVFFTSSFIVTLLQYFGRFSPTILNILLAIITVASFMTGGFIFGKKSIKKGWLEGIKLSTINILLFLVLNLILSNFQIKNMIFYLFILLSTTIGSIVGVNQKKI